MSPKGSAIVLIVGGGILCLSETLLVRVTGFTALIYGATFLILSRNKKT